jgi:hypothetical protein
VPAEPFDAPENLPKEAPRQVALGTLEDVVPRMLDVTSTSVCGRPHVDNGGGHPLSSAITVAESRPRVRIGIDPRGTFIDVVVPE